jgi:predicted NAD/FAD-dependent oxidoreductase
MSTLARDLATELRIECGQRIERVEGSAASWHVITEEGPAAGRFDAVVVATPAPQAVPLLAQAPRLAELVGGVEMQPCHAVMVTFPESIGVEFGGAFVAEPPLAWVARNAPCEPRVERSPPRGTGRRRGEFSSSGFRRGAAARASDCEFPRSAPLALRPHQAATGDALSVGR